MSADPQTAPTIHVLDPLLDVGGAAAAGAELRSALERLGPGDRLTLDLCAPMPTCAPTQVSLQLLISAVAAAEAQEVTLSLGEGAAAVLERVTRNVEEARG